ncbi:histidine phosphotransferase ChpT [Allosediminivita pacifica]|uniref:Histidine phosphotransferase ChpT n=2 Tax=Allosediminivita pacifica TaxID=1267769 RepID=A0A2T6AST1_9RHOB|nr:histidine phosphotransferase ChpT [Allosediminivita pacifica]
MSDDRAALAALVGSRLCHDLISPISAIQNGLELIALEQASAAPAPEMQLIQDSCTNATARIRLFRVAFGSAGSEQVMSSRDMTDILAGVTQGGRIAAKWTLTEDLPRFEAQLLSLAFLCCESALSAGGEVSFARVDGIWQIVASGPRMRIEPEIWACLGGPAVVEEISPSRVQFALLSLFARESGMGLLARTEETRIDIRIG